MPHKTKIAGTEYEITGGKVKLSATSYDITLGKVKIEGTGYEIPFKPKWENPTIYLDPGSYYFLDTPIYYNGYYYAMYGNSWAGSYSKSLYTGTDLANLKNKGVVGSSAGGYGSALSLVNGKLFANPIKYMSENTEMFNPRLYYGTPNNGSVTWNTLLYYSEDQRNKGQWPMGGDVNWFHYKNGIYYGFYNTMTYASYSYMYPIRFDSTFTSPVEMRSNYWVYDSGWGYYNWRSSYLLNNVIFLPYDYYKETDTGYTEKTYIKYLDLNTTDYISGSPGTVTLTSSDWYHAHTMFFKDNTYYYVCDTGSQYIRIYKSTDIRNWTVQANARIFDFDRDIHFSTWGDSINASFIDDELIVVALPRWKGSTTEDTAHGIVMVSKDLVNFETYSFTLPEDLDIDRYSPHTHTIRKAKGHYYVHAIIDNKGIIFKF